MPDNLFVRISGSMILDNHRDPAVGRIGRRRFIAQVLVGKPPHLPNLIGADSMLHQKLARRIGPVGREVPIRIAFLAAGKRIGIGMTLNQQVIRQRPKLLPQNRQGLFGRIRRIRIAALKEDSLRTLQQFNAQALRP